MGVCGGTGRALYQGLCVYSADGDWVGSVPVSVLLRFPKLLAAYFATHTLSRRCCSLDRAEVTDLFNESTLPHLMELLLGPRAEGPYHQVPGTKYPQARSSHAAPPTPLSAAAVQQIGCIAAAWEES